MGKQGRLSLYTTVRGRILLLSSIALLTFGIFNMATNSFAQELEVPFPENLTKEEILNYIILKALAQVGPLVAGGVGIGIDYLRRRGINISADAEEYFTKQISSLVANQSRNIYEKMKDEKEIAKYHEIDKKNGITEKKFFPKSLGKEAKQNVLNQLNVMLKSNEFTKHTRSILSTNLEQLVETAVTQNNTELTERSRKLIQLVGKTAVDAMLLPLESGDEAIKKKDEIIKSAMESIKNAFNFEEIQFDRNFAELFVTAELNKKIGKVR